MYPARSVSLRDRVVLPALPRSSSDASSSSSATNDNGNDKLPTEKSYSLGFLLDKWAGPELAWSSHVCYKKKFEPKEWTADKMRETEEIVLEQRIDLDMAGLDREENSLEVDIPRPK